jgi:hypothetical protein
VRGLFRRLREAHERVVRETQASSSINLALCYDSLLSADVDDDAAIEMIKAAAGDDSRGLLEFSDELMAEVDATDPLDAHVRWLFSAVAHDSPPPNVDPSDRVLFPAIRILNGAPLDEAASLLIERSPDLGSIAAQVRDQDTKGSSTRDLSETFNRLISDRLGPGSLNDDPLLRLSLSRRVFLDYLLKLAGREPEDEDER